MRWKTNKDAPPKDGDERTRVRFAWLPVPLDDGTTIWLAHYAIRERLFVLPDKYVTAYAPLETWIVVERAAMLYYP